MDPVGTQFAASAPVQAAQLFSTDRPITRSATTRASWLDD